VDFGARRFVRTEDLYKRDLVPLNEKDEAETAKILAEIGLLEADENQRIAELELERARAALALRTVRSPITGVVTERLVDPGEFARGLPIAKIAQIDPLRVEVFAPVALLGKVSVGMEAEVMPEAVSDGVYRVRVTVVDRVVDAASGTFGVRLELPNPDYRLPAGLKCKVRFVQ
jgi:multidrug efflux pump subunit AcrA (membrane-fusion protein)